MECHLYDPREYCLWNNRKEWHSDESGDDTVMRAGTWATVMRVGMAQWWKHRPLHYWWEQGWQSNRSRDGTMMRAGMAQWWEKGWHSDEYRDHGKSMQPSHEPPCRKRKQTSVTLNKWWKEWERGGENYLDDELSVQTMLQAHAQSTCKNASIREHMEFWHVRICKNRWILLILLVFNSVKLFLTASKKSPATKCKKQDNQTLMVQKLCWENPNCCS